MFPGLNVSDVEAAQSCQIDLHTMAHHRPSAPIVTVPLPPWPHQIGRLARMLAGMLAFLHLRHSSRPVA
ncbi:MAG TPA: hypothetical protein VGR22_11800 [Thermomicrobiales bacterium]|nr:hypothetical protein [Thermomicrobiales bacterium]